MKRALVLLLMIGVAAVGASAAAGSPLQDATQAVKVAPLQPVGGSGVSGFVILVQNPTGGSSVFVFATGLTPNTQYASFYYDDNACHVDPDLVGTFTSSSFGFGFVAAAVDEDVDEIGSVSVRTPDYSVLFACADTSG